MAFLKYAKNLQTKNFEYSDVTTYAPGWGTWGTTFKRDFNPRYVKVKPKSITYYPSNFSGKIKYKGNFSVPYQSPEKYHYDLENAFGSVKSIKAVVNNEKLNINKINWNLEDIIACEGVYCKPRLEKLFSGDDIVKAGRSDTRIETYGGNDKIIGSDVPRDINAGAGNDYIESRSSDNLKGGDGKDIFALCASANGATISDFEIGNDQIKLKGKGFESIVVKPEYSQGYYSAVISWGDNSEARLLRVNATYDDLFG